MSYATSPRCRLAAVILTLNEEHNITAAVSRLKAITSTVAIVDSFSSDHTIPVAEAAGAVCWQRAFDSFAAQRQFAIRRLTQEFNPDWIFTIDADERPSPDLVLELRRLIVEATKDPEWDAALIPRRIKFDGRWIKHGGFGNIRLIRLFRPSAGTYEDRPVNEHFCLYEGKRLGSLDGAIEHEDIPSWERHIAKHNTYSTLEAQERARRSTVERVSMTMALASPHLRRRFLRTRVWKYIPAPYLVRFIYMYIFARGFLDGAAGFRLALFYSWHELCITEKYEELLRAQPASACHTAGHAEAATANSSRVL